MALGLPWGQERPSPSALLWLDPTVFRAYGHWLRACVQVSCASCPGQCPPACPRRDKACCGETIKHEKVGSSPRSRRSVALNLEASFPPSLPPQEDEVGAREHSGGRKGGQAGDHLSRPSQHGLDSWTLLGPSLREPGLSSFL